jgi:predicted dienelactone hydrolase
MRSWVLLTLMSCAIDAKTDEADDGSDGDTAASDTGAEPDADTDTDTDTDADTDADLPVLPPDGPGPFSVGTFDAQLVGRTGVSLNVQVWYPSQESDGELHRYDGLYETDAQDAVAPDCAVVRPVVAFSHGNQGMRWQSYFWTERLATHGFVVVAPDHTGNTTFDFDEARVGELFLRRPLDISDTVDWLFAGSEPSEMGLGDCLDPAAGFAVGGHSFGGYTSVAVGGALNDAQAILDACEGLGGSFCEGVLDWAGDHSEHIGDMTDARVWAMVPMAPAGWGVLTDGLIDVAAPALVLGGDRDTLTTMSGEVTPIYSGLGSENKRLGELIDAGHMTFSNACDLADFEDCYPPFIDIEVAYAEINAVTVAFLRSVLGEDGMDPYLPNDAALWNWTTAGE